MSALLWQRNINSGFVIRFSQIHICKFESNPKVLTCPLSNEENYIQNELTRLIPHLLLDSVIGHPNWVQLQSSRLCKEVYVLLHYDLVKPVFGKLIDIVAVEQTVVLCVQEYYGHVFHAHYNTYEINTHGVIFSSKCTFTN